MQGDIELVHLQEYRKLEHKGPVRFWISDHAYIECMLLTNNTLEVRARNDQGSDELQIHPRCANVIQVGVESLP